MSFLPFNSSLKINASYVLLRSVQADIEDYRFASMQGGAPVHRAKETVKSLEETMKPDRWAT